MPVNSHHPEYSARIDQWARCRDVYEGSDAVKEGGTKYLPRPSGQSPQDYAAYLCRALFYDSFSRTVEGLVGSISRKAPKVDAPDAFDPILDDITLTGLSLLEFIKSTTRELLIEGRVGILVDWDEALSRPFATLYRAEQVINWFPDGSVILEEVVFEADPKDPFCNKGIKQWRLLHTLDGVYTMSVYRQKAASRGAPTGQFYIHEQRAPSSRGAALSQIPFFMLSPNGASSCVEKPPLVGFVDVVLSHYKTSADLEHGRHFTALPTLYITGTTDDDVIRIGGSAAITLSDANAKVGYAEFSGAGLASLEKGLEQKEQQMAMLGAGLFNGKVGGVEAAETARIRTSGENSLLSGIVSAEEDGMEKVLDIMAEWMRLGSAQVSLSINKDFIGEKISAGEVQAFVKAYIAGAITLEVFLHNLELGEALPPNTSIEEIAAQARSEQAAVLELEARTTTPPNA